MNCSNDEQKALKRYYLGVCWREKYVILKEYTRSTQRSKSKEYVLFFKRACFHMGSVLLYVEDKFQRILDLVINGELAKGKCQ